MSQKVIWITGASGGIGAALAVHLAREGNVVAISARSADKLTALATQNYGTGKIVSYSLDVTDAQAAAEVAGRIVKDLGGIDVAVLNAGTYIPDQEGIIDLVGI